MTIDANRDRDLYMQYRALRKEGFNRDGALKVLKQSDYGHLSRNTMKRIIYSFKKGKKNA